jgi:hypothetical protein
MKLSEILPQLTEKFELTDHRERDLPGGGTWWYVPWQVIRARLNRVAPDDWQVAYDDPKYLEEFCYLTCTLTICGVTRQAIGCAPIKLLSKAGRDMSRGNPIERAVADAFKNSCESFGIAAYLDDQADESTKREFAKWMHQRGNSKPAMEYHKANGDITDRPSTPKPTQSKPFGKAIATKQAVVPRPEPTPEAVPVHPNVDRVRSWKEKLGFSPANMRRFNESSGLPPVPEMSAEDLLEFRAIVLSNWGYQQGCFKAFTHARNAFNEFLSGQSNQDDDPIFEGWLAEVANRILNKQEELTSAAS